MNQYGERKDKRNIYRLEVDFGRTGDGPDWVERILALEDRGTDAGDQGN